MLPFMGARRLQLPRRWDCHPKVPSPHSSCEGWKDQLAAPRGLKKVKQQVLKSGLASQYLRLLPLVPSTCNLAVEVQESTR